MDTSKVYIKMCDCPEVQEKKPPFGKWDGLHEYTVGCVSDGSLKWLPRQDQIQGMLLTEFDEFSHIHCTFCNWALGMAEEFPSGEQLWLSFYMLKKHSLKWDGDEWNRASQG